MVSIVLHIGLPRTGTTVIQKYMTSALSQHLVIQKNPFHGSGNASVEKPWLVQAGPSELLERLSLLSPIPENISSVGFFNSCIASPAIGASQDPAVTSGRATYFPILCKAFELVSKTLEGVQKDCFITSERFSDTSSSLVCWSSHGSYDSTMPIFKICDAVSQATRLTPKVSVCFREPISYLRSKYLRTCLQRHAMGNQRHLSPEEFIDKQAKLERSSPGTSVLATAAHRDFLMRLQECSFVKAFGFSELISSDDVFALIGLQGEQQYSFKKFPRENSCAVQGQSNSDIEMQIIQELKACGFYKGLLDSQMFE